MDSVFMVRIFGGPHNGVNVVLSQDQPQLNSILMTRCFINQVMETHNVKVVVLYQ